MNSCCFTAVCSKACALHTCPCWGWTGVHHRVCCSRCVDCSCFAPPRLLHVACAMLPLHHIGSFLHGCYPILHSPLPPCPPLQAVLSCWLPLLAWIDPFIVLAFQTMPAVSHQHADVSCLVAGPGTCQDATYSQVCFFLRWVWYSVLQYAPGRHDADAGASGSSSDGQSGGQSGSQQESDSNNGFSVLAHALARLGIKHMYGVVGIPVTELASAAQVCLHTQEALVICYTHPPFSPPHTHPSCQAGFCCTPDMHGDMLTHSPCSRGGAWLHTMAG